VKLGGGLLDGAVELLDAAVRVADRAVDPDSVHARADLRGELGVHHGGLLERLLLVGPHEPGAALLVEHGGAQPLPPPALPRLLASAAAHGDVDGERRRKWAAQQVREPGRVGVHGRRSEVQDLLERPVGVAQPSGIFAGVDPALGALAARRHQPVTCAARLLDRGGRRDLASGRERQEVALLLGRWVQALPQQRERLRSVERIGLDPGRAQCALDLQGHSGAVVGRVAMSRQQRPAA
jgi:hypothetical protein